MILANKYRPKCWQEVVGQPTVISVLQRQIATRKWKNAYLFCGPHGTGKTTVARIFAREINSGFGEPIEIDAATNNGVDSMRALIADSQQSSIDCDFKVYVIDECHMITIQGWNALLKIIEEPPLRTVFIFCTTNPDKLPDTILSRLQRFDFKRASTKAITDRMAYIMNEEIQGNYDVDSLERIANCADGHIRDAIQYLDKCLDANDNLTIENVEQTLGVIKKDSIIELFKGILGKDIKMSVNELNKIKSYSSDMLKVFDQLFSFSVDCCIFCGTDNSDFIYLPDELKTDIKNNENIIKVFIERLSDFRKYATSDNSEALLKAVLIEMCGD